MKKLALLLITLFSISIYAQKAEVKSAEKLFKKGNLVDALSTVNQACKLKDQADTKTKAKIMFVKSKILVKLGEQDMTNYEKAIKVIKKLQAFEEKEGKKRYSDDAQKLLDDVGVGLGKIGQDSYAKKDFLTAAKAFDLINQIKKDDNFAYYASVAYLQAKKWDKSLPILKELFKNGYTGQNKVFNIVEKSTGKVVDHASDKFTAIAKAKAKGEGFDVKEGLTKSLRSDVISNILYVIGQKGDDDEAIKFIEEAKKEDPKNIELIVGEANYYLKKGDNTKFAAAMKNAVEMDPTNKLYNFNLATAYYQLKKYDEAKKYYQKTIEIDPNYVDAYKGLAYIVLVPEKALTEKMNTDEVLMNDKLFNKYKKQQLDLYRKALPYFESAEKAAPKDEEVLNALKKIYRDLEMKDKLNQVKAKISALK